eukprot:g36688.t1
MAESGKTSATQTPLAKSQALLSDYLNKPKADRNGDLRPFDPIFLEIIETGNSSCEWASLRALLEMRLLQVLEGYKKDSPAVQDLDGEEFETRLERVCLHLTRFPRPPFTLQRISELLMEPRRYYATTAKFFLAFSKLVTGISARDFDQETRQEYEEKGRDGPPFGMMHIEGSDFQAFQERMNQLPIETKAIGVGPSSTTTTTTAMDTGE